MDASTAHGSAHTVVEGSLVNLGVTSPAATLALMLMYLKTNDAQVAAKFYVPDTHYALDFVRPDLLVLRLLGRALVLWDGIAPSTQWVEAQLPPLLRTPLLHCLSKVASGARDADWQALALARINSLAGLCLAIGLRFAGSCSAPAEAVLRCVD